MPPEIVFRAVKKGYGSGTRRVEVLRELTWSVEKGMLACVMGPSGSGKSTLLNLIGGLDIPDAGQVMIQGEVISAYTDEQRTRFRRGRIGYLFQYHHLLEEFTVLENCMLPLLLLGHGHHEAKNQALAHLEALGLAHLLSRYPLELSGGEAQRVALVRAALGGLSLFLADEPTGNLDAQAAEEVMEWIIRLHNIHGWTSVLVTHNMKVAQKADKIFRLEDGIIREINHV